MDAIAEGLQGPGLLPLLALVLMPRTPPRAVLAIPAPGIGLEVPALELVAVLGEAGTQGTGEVSVRGTEPNEGPEGNVGNEEFKGGVLGFGCGDGRPGEEEVS